MEFLNKLKEVFKENNIEVLSFENEKGYIEYKCLSCGEIYKHSCARNLLSKITLCKRCYSPYQKWKKENVLERMKRLYPFSNIEIIEFNGFRKGGIVKCKKCGKEEKINNFEAVFSARKDFYCFNCEKEKHKIYEHLLNELEMNSGALKLLQWNGVNEKSQFKCLRCGNIFYKRVTTNFSGLLCPNCYKVVNKFDFKQAQEYLKKYGKEEYDLLQFKGIQFKSLVKHKCGFCFSMRLEDFKLGKIKGCPKCFKKMSKGEQIIYNFLKEEKFIFEYQKRFDDFKKYSYDFAVYLNGQMVLLEFQGEQHYKSIEVFDSLKTQKQRDEKKKEYCLINNIPLIEIPYWEIKNIPEYLMTKFKDYLEKE